MTTEKNDVFDIKEFRKRAGLNPASYYTHNKAGNIPKKVLFYQKDVDDFKKNHMRNIKNLLDSPTESKTYTKEEFMTAAGISEASMWVHLNRQHLKKKDIYTQKDLDTLLKNHPPRNRKKEKDTIITKHYMETKTDKNYDWGSFMEAAGLNDNSFNLHRTRGNLPKKDIYTQKDLETFQKNHPNAGKINRVSSIVSVISSDNAEKYTREQLAEKIGLKPKSIYNLWERKILPRKKMYSDLDIQNYLNYRSGTKEPISTLKPAVHNETEENPFEIIDATKTSSRNAGIMSKFIESLIQLPIYEGDKQKSVRVPSSIYPTSQKAQSALLGAKRIIQREYKALKNVQYTIESHKNAASVYTHSLVFRTN